MLPLFAVHLYRALNSPDRIDTDIDTPPKHRRNTPTVSSTASITEKMLECLVPSKTAVLDPPLVAVTPIVVQVDGDDPVKLDLDTHPPATSLIAASPPESRASLFLSVITSRNTTMTDREHSCTELIALAGSRTPRTAQFLLLNGVMDSLIDHVLCFVASSMEKQFVKNRIEELQKQQSKFMECSKLEKELRQLAALKTRVAPLAIRSARLLIVLAKATYYDKHRSHPDSASTAVTELLLEVPHHQRVWEGGSQEDDVFDAIRLDVASAKDLRRKILWCSKFT